MKSKTMKYVAEIPSSGATYVADTGSDSSVMVLNFKTSESLLLDRLDSMRNEPESVYDNPQGLREHLRALRR